LNSPGHAGWVGVDLFFALSGFLITRILCEAKEHSRYFINFYMRRTLRIFPLYFGALFIAFGMEMLFPTLFGPWIGGAVHRQGWWWLYGTNIVIAKQGHWISPMLDHFWSLAVEEHFYLVWPALVLLLQRRALMWVCGLCMVGSLALRAGILLHNSDTIAPYVLTPCRIDALAAGALVALAFRSGFGVLLGSMARIAAPLAAVLLMAAAIWRRGWTISDPFVQSVGLSLLSVFCAASLILAVTARRTHLINAACAYSGMAMFGKYSYGLYVFHVMLFPAREVFLLPAMAKWFPTHPMTQFSVYVFIAGASSLMAAYLSFHCYEKHFLKLKRFFSSATSRPAASAVAQPGFFGSKAIAGTNV
jgi:peptidoglycan/LPS O-acetylase OafA/YrhL